MQKISALLQELCGSLILPYPPGLESGGKRVLVGLWGFLVLRGDKIAAQRISEFLKNTANIKDTPLCSLAQDPLSVLLGHSPLTNWEKWSAQPIPLNLSLFNPYFLRLIESHLEIVKETCLENDVEAKRSSLDKTLVHRLWQQVLPLTEICLDHSLASSELTWEEVRKNALAQKAVRQKNILKRVHKNWYKPNIGRKRGGPKSLLQQYEALGVSDPTKIISWAGRWEGGLSAGVGKTSETTSERRKLSFGHEDIHLVSYEGDISAGHLVDIVRKAKTMPDSLGATAIELMLAGFVHPGAISQINREEIGDYIVLETPLNQKADYEGWDASFLLPKGVPFKRVVPTQLFNRYVHLAKDLPLTWIVDQAKVFLQSVEKFIGIGMVERFLASQAPLWYGLPRTFAAFGFATNGEPNAIGGWIAYARHHPEMATLQGKKYFELIGIDVESMAKASSFLNSCGSGGVARPEVVRELFAIFLERISKPFKFGSDEEAILLPLAKWNGTVAIFAIALQLLCFRRPYQFSLPRIGEWSEIEREKMGPRKILLSSITRELSEKIYIRWLEVYRQLPKKWTDNWPPVDTCAAFVTLPRPRVLPVPRTNSSAPEITRWLAHDKELSKYATIFPGFPRHTADYALRLGGLSESEIDLLTDHSLDRARARISKNNLDGPASTSLHAHGEHVVAEYLGLLP